MNKVYTALDMIKGKDESWEQLFARANKEGGIDLKTIIKVLVAILEEIDNVKTRITPERTTLPRESGEISTGTGQAKKEIQDKPSY